MKTADVSKVFLVIFERTYDGLYICHILFDRGAILRTPTEKEP